MPNIIYQITNKVNGKTYIGKTTKSVEERFRRHITNHKTGKTHLYSAMRKHGIENFIVSILEEVVEAIDDRERLWIANLSPEYNMTKGGEGGDTSDSINYKNGMLKRDLSGPKNPMFGRKRTDTAKYLFKAKEKTRESNRCPVVCHGKVYTSVGEAQTHYNGINLRKRLDNPKYPEFYRLRERTRRK
jgi:group I intron endonuclease